MKINGYLPPRKKAETPSLGGSIESVIQTVNDLNATKKEVVTTLDKKVKEIDSHIENAENTLDRKIRDVDFTIKNAENSSQEIIKQATEIIKNIEPRNGENGKDAEPLDKDEIVKEVLSKIPEAPKLDKKSLIKEVISAIPQNKASLKIIQETFETDPMSVIEKIMALPEDKLKKFKLKSSQIDGLDQTISAFNSQLSRGYLHGGGDTVVAGTNITITQNANGNKVISSTGGGSAAWGTIGAGTGVGSQTDLVTYLTTNYQGKITTGTTAQYFKGDLSLGTFPTALSSFTNDTNFTTLAAVAGVGYLTDAPSDGNTYGRKNGAWASITAGTGTVTSVSVTTANGISGTVATATTTPAITLSLGAITPTSVNGLTIQTTTGTFKLTNGKTFEVDNSLVLAGADFAVLTLNTNLTVGTGNVSLIGNVANTSALTIGAGAVSVSGANTGDQTLTVGGTTSPTIALSGSNTATFAHGTGITLGQATGTITITNSAPDQTVAFSGGTNVTIGGTYPNFTITDNSINSSVATLSSLTSVGNLTTGSIGTGFVVKGVTMTLGSDATGDVYYRAAGGVLTRLAVGTASQALIGGTVPAWGTPWTALGYITSSGVSGMTSGQLAKAGSATTITSSIAYSTTPTASTIAEWDANKNLSTNNLIEAWATTLTSGSTVTLTVSSAYQQYFTGSTNQAVTLPTTGVAQGQQWQIVNQSSALVFVQSSGLNAILQLFPGTSAVFTALVATPTTAANWAFSYAGATAATQGFLTTQGSFGITLIASGTTSVSLPTSGTLVNSAVTTLSSLTSVGTITSGGLGTGAVIGGVTMTLGSDASYDMYYRGATGVLTRLANGTTGQVLTATTSGAPSWGSAGAGDMVLASVQTVTGAKTFGTIGGAVGKFILAGSTSGSTIVNAAAVAGSTTLTLPGVTDTIAVLGTAQTFTANQTFNNVLYAVNAITASGNAATVPVTYRISKVTNNSAATLTITVTTTSAVDGQFIEVLVLDASAVAQTITWVNTENTSVTIPPTSNGSTTKPLRVQLQYNSGTSLWSCIGYA